jgi:hypothetical protein
MKAAANFLIILLFFLTAGEGFALPRFALGVGGTCIDCHVNPTGGGMRNSSGWSYGKNVLPLVSPRKEFEMNNKIAENIGLGLDFRGQLLVQTTDSTTKADFHRMSAAFYSSINLSEEINVYARYDFLQSIWEGYVTAHILPNNSYIKGGSFTPNYGIRIDDHTAYTRGGDMGVLFSTGGRRGLIYSPTYVEQGVELGAYLSDFAFLTASVGNPGRRLFAADPSYTANLQIVHSISDVFNFMAGGSFANFKDPRGFHPVTFSQLFQNINMYGGYAGISFGRFVLLAQYDIAKDLVKTDSTANALMIEASYRIVKGLDAIVRYDRFDPNKDAEKDDVSRLIIGLEFFPYSFLEIRPQYRIQMEQPKVKNDSFLIHAHIYY